MNSEAKVLTPEAERKESFFHRLFGEHGHETSGSDTPSKRSTTTTLNLGDIQGFILRGYRMPIVRHFLLTEGDPAEARKLLGRLVSASSPASLGSSFCKTRLRTTSCRSRGKFIANLGSGR
jgi:hypothetical protein